MMDNKKGISAIVIVAVLLLVCIAFYLVLYIPIPSFKALRTVINYFLTIIVFILLQVAIILGYYYAGKYTVKGFNLYKDRIQKTFMNIKDYVITKGR